MHHPTDRITHTTTFVTPVMEHWLEREIAQWVHHEGSIWWPITPWANALTTELHLAQEKAWMNDQRKKENIFYWDTTLFFLNRSEILRKREWVKIEKRLVNGLMDGYLEGWMDGWLPRSMIGWMVGWLDGWMDGWMVRWMGKWMNREVGGGWLEGWMTGLVNGCMKNWVDEWVDDNKCNK